MIRTARHVFGVAAFALALSASAWAQDTVRVRGAIERVDGNTLLIKARDGADVKVVLASNALIVAIVKASMADIKQGSFVGVTGMPQADGSQRAIEVHIFPESMRGTGEGHYPWDLRPGSTMTNANVEQTVSAVDGQTLSVKYKGGEKKLIVPPDATLSRIRRATRTSSSPGRRFSSRRQRSCPMARSRPRV
jgi:hypothetical protein